MEVMVGATPEMEALIRGFLNSFDVLPIEATVSEAAVKHIPSICPMPSYG